VRLATRSGPGGRSWIARLTAALLLPLAGASDAAASDFWGRVVDPDAQAAEALVTRARSHLDRSLAGGPTLEQGVRAQQLLEQALERKPRHFRARFLLADALAVQGRRAEAITAFDEACPLAPAPEEAATCSRRLAVELSRAGRLADALSLYDRQLETDGDSATAYLNSAELLMAQGPSRLPEAVARYRQAVALEERAPPGPDRDQGLALGLYGLAVALDRDGQPARAREAMVRAVRIDPRLRLLEVPGEPGAGDVFFVPPADAHYYLGLALVALDRQRQAAFAFRHFLAEATGSPYAAAAEGHLARLGGGAGDLLGSSGPRFAPVPPRVRPPRAPGAGPGAAAGDGGVPPAPRGPPAHPPLTRRWRLAAAATVESNGPIPAPLIDAAWKGQPRLYEPCFEEAPALATRTVRLVIDIRLDARGVLTRVDAKVPAEWPEAQTCLTDRTRGVRFPKPPRPEPTTAKIQLVVSMSGKS
jgi:tetratricopeptide (TPR) repeat protein